MTISQLIGFSTDSSIFHEMKNGEDSKNLEFSPFFSVPDVIRTRGLPLRRRTLYPAELQKRIKNRSFLPELNLCYSFVIFTWSMFEHSLRRRLLYPFNYENECRIFGLFSLFGIGNHIYESNHSRDELPLFLILTSQAPLLESNSKFIPFSFQRVQPWLNLRRAPLYPFN